VIVEGGSFGWGGGVVVGGVGGAWGEVEVCDMLASWFSVSL